MLRHLQTYSEEETRRLGEELAAMIANLDSALANQGSALEDRDLEHENPAVHPDQPEKETHPSGDHSSRGEFAANNGLLVALSGDLGSGKTALIRGICRYFKCEQQVTSPTFTIANEYFGTRKILHYDLYRLGTTREMLETGLEETFRGDDVVLVEWAEKAVDLLAVPRLEIAARHGDSEEERRFAIQLCTKDDRTILAAPDPLQWSLS